MSYTKTNWVNGVTPVNADNMNKIENELEALDQRGSAGTRLYKHTLTCDIEQEWETLIVYSTDSSPYSTGGDLSRANVISVSILNGDGNPINNVTACFAEHYITYLDGTNGVADAILLYFEGGVDYNDVVTPL